MIKKLILLVLVCVSLQAKDIILWDLHKVVLNRSTGNTISAVLNKNMAQSVTNLDWAQFKNLLSLSLDNVINPKSSEDYIHLAKTYNNQSLINLILDIANAQTIMPGMQELILELDTLKIEQQVGSNIGKTSFDQLIKNPEFSPIFDRMKLDKSKVVEFDPKRIIKKPDPLFFKQYLEKNNYNPTKTRIIFIDDKKENIDTANTLGLIGIHFRDVDQLRQELNKLGIAVTPPKQKQIRFEGYKHLFR